jgi:replication initiator protein
MERRLFRTIDARSSDDSMIKPGELVDLVEMTPLTLADRRIYNQLIAHAWEKIDQGVEHVISKRELAGNHNGYDRVGESVERLMAAIVKVRVVQDGKPAIERVQLLGSNTEYETPDGQLRYEFPAKLRHIIRESTIFARLRLEVMFALSSKYALALYEMVQKRGNLTAVTHEEFSLREFRDLLGIPKGRLPIWGNLHQRAIAPAVKEVTALSDYEVTVEPVKTGRKVTGVRLAWSRKDTESVHRVWNELQRPRIGRKARLAGTVETVDFVPPALPNGGLHLKSGTYEEARRRFKGYDIYHVEQEWRDWSAGKEPPRNADAAFLAFFAKYVERHPL